MIDPVADRPAVGRLYHRVTLQAWQPKRDELGQQTGFWSDVATVWANVQQQTGREEVNAQETIAVLECLVTIRYRPGIVPQMQVVWRGRTMGIANVREIGGRFRYLELSCVRAT